VCQVKQKRGKCDKDSSKRRSERGAAIKENPQQPLDEAVVYSKKNSELEETPG
jgi:hypothetical protein